MASSSHGDSKDPVNSLESYIKKLTHGNSDILTALENIRIIEGEFFGRLAVNFPDYVNSIITDIKNKIANNEIQIPADAKDYDNFFNKLDANFKNADWESFWNKFPEKTNQILLLQERILLAYRFKVISELFKYLAGTNPEDAKLATDPLRAESMNRFKEKTINLSTAPPDKKAGSENSLFPSPKEDKEVYLKLWVQSAIRKYNTERSTKLFYGRAHDNEVRILANIFDIDVPQKNKETPLKYEKYTLMEKIQEIEKMVIKIWGLNDETLKPENKSKTLERIKNTLNTDSNLFGRGMLGLLQAIYKHPSLQKFSANKRGLESVVDELMQHEAMRSYSFMNIPLKPLTKSGQRL